ncbi:hypothetical protein GCM10027589_21980 [Actinocorallia lasiicapitis]
MIRAAVPIAALALGLLPAPAHAAAPQPFKVVKTTNLRGQDGFSAVIAPSRKSAFAFGSRGAERENPYVYRYDGKKWAKTALPKVATKGFIADVDYSSASNVYAVVPGNFSLLESTGPIDPGAEDDCPETSDSRTRSVSPQFGAQARLRQLKAAAGNARRAAEPPSRLLRWNGKKWTVGATFKSALIMDVVAFGPKDVRVFGVDKKGPAAWRFNGKSWKKSALPNLVITAVKSKRSVWAITAGQKDGYYRLVEQSAKGWKDRTPPQVPAFVMPTKDKAGTMSLLTSVTASSGRIYVASATMTAKLCQEDADWQSNLFAGDGRTWRSIALPKSFSPFSIFMGGTFSADGKGGLYVPTYDGKPALFRLSAKGKWSSQQLSRSVMLTGFAVVPGTSSSLWAAGAKQGDWDEDGVIALRGKA